MRKLVLGMLLAAGAALPTMAIAEGATQDRPQEDHHRGSGEHRNGGGRPAQPRPAPQAAAAVPAQPRPQAAPAAPQAQAPARPQAQPQGRAELRGNGGLVRGDAGARFNRGDPSRGQQGFGADAGQPNRGFNREPNRGGSPQGFRPDAGRPDRGASQPGYGPQGGPGGYAPQQYGRGPGQQYRPGPGAPGQARPNGGGNWNRGWRGDNRYDWGRYRAQNRGAFHLPRYYAPRSWQYGYRRFSPGFTLSFGLFDRSYWIDDAYEYRLPPAYWPYQWVRYYNDALLVDVRTGYVVDTVYDIFW